MAEEFVSRPAAGPDGKERRRHKRTRVLRMAEVIDGAGREAWTIVMDISQGGAKLRLDDRELYGVWAAGKSLTVRFDNGVALDALIVWRKGRTIGCEFRDEAETVADALGPLIK